MVCHVGYNGDSGKVSVFDTENNEIKCFGVPSVNPNKTNNFNAEPIFEGIIAEFHGKEMGCFCVYLAFCRNEIRKKLIEGALKSGFKKAKIIDYWATEYLNPTLQTEYQPKNGDIIWIVYLTDCFIYKKENGISKYVDYFSIFDDTNFEQVFDETKWKPNVIFVSSDSINFDKKKAAEMVPFCAFNKFSPNAYEFSAMTKARIMANDPAVMEWDIQTMLEREMIIKQGDKMIIEIERFQSLPITKTIKLQNENDAISVQFKEAKVEVIANPGSLECKLEIDKNGIWSISLMT